MADLGSGCIDRNRVRNLYFFLDHDWLARLTNYYYAIAHIPALVLFLVWLFFRHRDAYPHWRNGLAILTAFCLIIRFIRVALPHEWATRRNVDPDGTSIRRHR